MNLKDFCMKKGNFLFLVKVSLKIPSKNRLQGDFLWGVAPNPTCFLKKASQKLLFVCDAKKAISDWKSLFSLKFGSTLFKGWWGAGAKPRKYY